MKKEGWLEERGMRERNWRGMKDIGIGKGCIEERGIKDLMRGMNWRKKDYRSEYERDKLNKKGLKIWIWEGWIEERGIKDLNMSWMNLKKRGLKIWIWDGWIEERVIKDLNIRWMNWRKGD